MHHHHHHPHHPYYYHDDLIMETSDGFNVNLSKAVPCWWQEVQAGVHLIIIGMMMMIMHLIIIVMVMKVKVMMKPTSLSGGLTGLSTLRKVLIRYTTSTSSLKIKVLIRYNFYK